MALSHSQRSHCEKRPRELDQVKSIELITQQCVHETADSLTGMYSGSHSGMFRLLISMEIFLRCPGLVTPMAVRSCTH